MLGHGLGLGFDAWIEGTQITINQLDGEPLNQVFNKTRLQDQPTLAHAFG
jgi:hypothetical protein